MTYQVKTPPLEEKDLATWAWKEFSRIEETFNQQDFISLGAMAREPEKPRDGLVVYADGDNWDPGNGAGYYGYISSAWRLLGAIAPAFRVHKNGTDQTIPSGADTLLTWSTEEFDTNSNFASNRFTASVPGKYYINFTARISNLADGTSFSIKIYKNGAEYARGSREVTGAAASVVAAVFADLVLMAAGDYLEFYAAQTSGGDLSVLGLTVATHASGVLIA